MRIFLTLMVLVGGLAGLAGGSALAASSEDKAAFKAAYARYNAAVEAQDAEAAVAAASEALELGKLVYADDHPNLANLYLNKGYALVDADRKRDSIEPLKEGLSRFEKLYGNKDERLIQPLYTLATAHKSKGGVSERKIAYLLRVKDLLDASPSTKKVDAAQINLEIGMALTLKGETRGYRYLQEAYDQFYALAGTDTYQTGVAALWLGKYDFVRKKRKKAEKWFLEALDVFEKTAPPGREFDIGTHSYLVRLYEQMGQSEKADQHCRAISLLRPQAVVDGYFPLYKEKPIYPQGPLRSGREGTVIVEFSVTSIGTVANPRVVESQGGKGFEKAALKAVLKFRYAPAVENGVPIATDGVKNRISFRIG